MLFYYTDIKKPEYAKKKEEKKEERKSKKITGHLYISYGFHDLFRTASAGGSTQDVYNSAGKNLDEV